MLPYVSDVTKSTLSIQKNVEDVDVPIVLGQGEESLV
jgi:hypothetical protein